MYCFFRHPLQTLPGPHRALHWQPANRRARDPAATPRNRTQTNETNQNRVPAAACGGQDGTCGTARSASRRPDRSSQPAAHTIPFSIRDRPSARACVLHAMVGVLYAPPPAVASRFTTHSGLRADVIVFLQTARAARAGICLVRGSARRPPQCGSPWPWARGLYRSTAT
jgi:hypothetical protein